MMHAAEEVLGALQSIWRRRWVAIAVAWVAALAGFVVVWGVPNRYEASARVYVDTQTVLKPLMAGLTFQPDTDQQVRMMAKTLLSRPNIERLLKTPGLDMAERGESADHTVDRLLDRIKVDSSGGNLYIISFRDTNPARAKAIVGSLVNLFVDTGMNVKQRDSTEAGTFIDEQIKNYEGKLSAAENRLKEFKTRNFGVSGVSSQDYYARIAATADEVTRLKIAYAAAEHSREALKRELASEDPRLPVEATAQPAAPAALSELDLRIDAQRKQLDELLRKYTEAHPDVVSTRQTIRSLEAQRAAEKAAQGTGRTAGSAATSPVFQRIRISLAEAEANVASLGAQLSAQQQRLDELRGAASKLPQAEAELSQLNRDYDVIRHNYDLLVSRREAATLGVKMDQSDQLADFRVIEPPHVAPKAVFPDRTALSLGAMLLSLAVGLAVAYALELVYPTFSTPRQLQDLVRRPVIGTVSIYPSAELLTAQRRDLKRVALAVGALLVVQGGWIAMIAARFGHAT